MPELIFIAAIVYLLCVHKVSHDLRMWIYKRAYIITLSHSQTGTLGISTEPQKTIEKLNWYMPLIYEWISCYFCAGVWLGAAYFMCTADLHISFWILAWHMIKFSLSCGIVSGVCCSIQDGTQR